MTAPPPRDLRCERARLLLSLRADAATTAAQSAELDEHLAACADCRRAGAADRAVGDRLRERAGDAAPAGFAAAVVAAAVAERVAAAAQNRFLRWSCAAAVFVAALAVGWARTAGDAARPGGVADAREAAQLTQLGRLGSEGRGTR